MSKTEETGQGPKMPVQTPLGAAVCGIIMPISAIDGCEETHWQDVLQIISDAVKDAQFEANIVSSADEAGTIHKRIVQNLYDNPIVICDVSGRNPNVMFELGMRLAFDKPTIIVKDDRTPYSFDTSVIEHLEYPRDLRFSKIVDFKRRLKEKITATHERWTSDKGYTTFLKHFGEFKVAELDQKEVSGQEFIIGKLNDLDQSIRRIEMRSYPNRINSLESFNFCLVGLSEDNVAMVDRLVDSHPAVLTTRIRDFEDHKHLIVRILPRLSTQLEGLREEISEIISTLPRTESKRLNRRPRDMDGMTNKP